jgi:hypothetical protein
MASLVLRGGLGFGCSVVVKEGAAIDFTCSPEGGLGSSQFVLAMPIKAVMTELL